MVPKKLKIAIFHCAFIYNGGGERIALEEALGLSKKGYRVDLFAPAVDASKCFPDLLEKAKVKTIFPQLPKWVLLRDAFSMIYTSMFVWVLAPKFAGYDFFIGANQPGVWIAFVLSKILRKKYVIYLNQPNRIVYPRKIDIETGWKVNKSFEFLHAVFDLLTPLVAVLDKLSVRGAETILVNGDYIGAVISNIYGKKVVECSAGADPFGPIAQLKSKSIVVNGNMVAKPYLLITNRHYPQKKFEYGIEAFKATLPKNKDLKLVISGGFTPYTDKLRRLVKKLGLGPKVIFLGEVKNVEMGKLYANSEIYLYTSPEEDYGMGVVEAEYAGVPVVAWKNAGPTATVVDGKTGYLARPFNTEDFASKVSLLLSNDKKRIEMGKAAKLHVFRNFSWKRHVDIMEKAIIKSVK